MEIREDNILLIVYDDNESRQLVLSDDAKRTLMIFIKAMAETNQIGLSKYNLGKVMFEESKV